MSNAPDTRRGLLWAFCGSAGAAAFLIPWKIAVEHGEPQLAVLMLLSTAALFNSGTALVNLRRAGGGGPAGTSWRATLQLSCAFAVLTLLGNWCSAEAISRISGALLAVVQRSEVILVALLGALLLREGVRSSFWVGTAMAGIGLWILQRPGSTAGDFDPLGVLYGLASAACFGSMVLLTRRWVSRVKLVPMNAIRLWMSVALWFSVEQRIPRGDELPAELVAGGALAGFFGPFLARLSILQSSRYIPANTTALAALATPVLALLFAFFVLGTLPTERELLGGAVMLVGIAVPVTAMWLSARRSR
ncbi:MAG: DMT family transporter [Myxococcales bacterium]|nr:DMT family transporter [Myxococcales bacterium]